MEASMNLGRETDADPIGHAAAKFDARMVEVDEGISVRVFHWEPLQGGQPEPLVFLPGYVSAISGWVDVLREIVPIRPLYYLESREKISARIDRKTLTPDDFSVARLANDLIAACDSLGLVDDSKILAGSSLGATTVLEALKHNRLKGKAGFMIGPNSEFRAPWFIKMLLQLPANTYHLLKYFMIWYLATFRVDAVKEPEQMQRYRDTLLTAEPHRLKMCAKSAITYTIWSDLETVTVPIVLTLAVTDKLHTSENILRMKQLMKKAEILECESNKYMHSPAIAANCETFVRRVS
jgi:pimeloyl-ACP methyl ester carboxylesterase